MRAVEMTPTDLPMSDAISANVLVPAEAPAAQSFTATESRMLIIPFFVLMPEFIAAAVGAESGVCPFEE